MALYKKARRSRHSTARTTIVDFAVGVPRSIFRTMSVMIVTIAIALASIAAFSAVGFVVVKSAFLLVCVIGGHNLLEAMFGLTTPVVLGAAIGLEAFLWYRERNQYT